MTPSLQLLKNETRAKKQKALYRERADASRLVTGKPVTSPLKANHLARAGQVGVGVIPDS
jgi:hypothetical protein